MEEVHGTSYRRLQNGDRSLLPRPLVVFCKISIFLPGRRRKREDDRKGEVEERWGLFGGGGRRRSQAQVELLRNWRDTSSKRSGGAPAHVLLHGRPVLSGRRRGESIPWGFGIGVAGRQRAVRSSGHPAPDPAPRPGVKTGGEAGGDAGRAAPGSAGRAGKGAGPVRCH